MSAAFCGGGSAALGELGLEAPGGFTLGGGVVVGDGAAGAGGRAATGVATGSGRAGGAPCATAGGVGCITKIVHPVRPATRGRAIENNASLRTITGPHPANGHSSCWRRRLATGVPCSESRIRRGS